MIEDTCRIAPTARIQFPDLVNLYGCEVADNCVVGPFVEIQAGVSVGRNSKIESHTFICTGVSIGADVFVGHGVTFTNDLYPVIDSAFVMRGCIVGRGVSIGSGATILPVVIGVHSIIGAGAVVCDDLPPLCVAVGNPARVIQQFRSIEERNAYIAYRQSHHLHTYARLGEQAGGLRGAH